jgi:hypothetical protein
MKRTLLFVLALIASAPTDGVAQGFEPESRALVTKLYEGRSCRRGSEAYDLQLERLGANAPPSFLEAARELNCKFVLPDLDFEILKAGPGGWFKLNSAESEDRYSNSRGLGLSYNPVTPGCVRIMDRDTFGQAFVSLRSGEIFPLADSPRECFR